MVDVDDQLLFEVDQTWAVDVRAFNDEHAVVFAIDGGRDANQFGAGKVLVSMRRRIAHDDLDVLPSARSSQ